jgi:hypothetical protein
MAGEFVKMFSRLSSRLSMPVLRRLNVLQKPHPNSKASAKARWREERREEEMNFFRVFLRDFAPSRSPLNFGGNCRANRALRVKRETWLLGLPQNRRGKKNPGLIPIEILENPFLKEF